MAQHFEKSVLVVATKLKRVGSSWKFTERVCSKDFQNIKNSVHKQFWVGVSVLPLKGSEAAFDGIIEHEISVEQRIEKSALLTRQFGDIAKQFNAIYTFIEKCNNG